VAESMTCTAALAAPAAGVQHTNTGTVVGTPAAPDGTPIPGATPVTDTDPANAVVPHLQLDKKAWNPEVVEAGATVTWKVQIQNAGLGSATDVVVVDEGDITLDPDSIVFTGPSQGTVEGGTWMVGDLAAGEIATAYVTSRVSSSYTAADGVVLNFAHIGTIPPETCQINTEIELDTDGCDYDGVMPSGHKLQVDKIFGSDVIVAGKTVDFLITARNDGPGRATGVVVKDLGGEGLGAVTITNPSKGTVEGGIWQVGDLAAGEIVTAKATAAVLPEASAVVNRVTVEDPTLPVGNSCNANETVEGDSDQCDLVTAAAANGGSGQIQAGIVGSPVNTMALALGLLALLAALVVLFVASRRRAERI